MAEPNEPKKETTRIIGAPEAVEKPAEPGAKKRDTVQLPLRESPVHIVTEPRPGSNPVVPEVVSPQFFQAPQPPPIPSNVSVMPAPDLPSSGPTKETVRIPLRAVQMKKTQPLVAMPEMAPENRSIAVTPVEKNQMPLLWLLLGMSAVILIIQIWTYLS
jgi:hypothetical protein